MLGPQRRAYRLPQTLMTHEWKHPKYWKELRKIRAASFKQQAPDEPQATSSGSQKPQATSSKNRGPL